MIELSQNDNYLIGSKDKQNLLSKKDHARILVISDSHGNFNVLKKILEQYGETCDAFVFCGDGITDIAEILETANENQTFRNKLPDVIAFVRGNGDPSTYPVSFDIGKNNTISKNELKGTIIVPDYQTLTVNNTNFLITHGHLTGINFGDELLLDKTIKAGCSVAIFGHTHVATQEMINDSIKFINPGSCSRPRDGKPGGFAIITVEKTFTDTAFIKITNPYSDTPSFLIEK